VFQTDSDADSRALPATLHRAGIGVRITSFRSVLARFGQFRTDSVADSRALPATLHRAGIDARIQSFRAVLERLGGGGIQGGFQGRFGGDILLCF